MIIDKHQTTLNVHQLIRIDGHISKYSLYMPISTLEELKEICNICLHPKGWNLEKYNESHFADWGKTDKRSIIYKYQHAQSSKYWRYHQEGDRNRTCIWGSNLNLKCPSIMGMLSYKYHLTAWISDNKMSTCSTYLD